MVEFLQAMNWHDFVVQVTASMLGAGLGGLVAYAIARSSIRADRQVREAEAAERHADRAARNQKRLKRARSVAIQSLLLQMAEALDVRASLRPDRPLDMAIAGLLIDGGDEEYDVYRWVQWMCRPPETTSPTRELAQRYDVVRASLLGWNSSEDNAGTLASIRRQLEEASGQ
jgi:hypothetical protein